MSKKSIKKLEVILHNKKQRVTFVCSAHTGGGYVRLNGVCSNQSRDVIITFNDLEEMAEIFKNHFAGIRQNEIDNARPANYFADPY